MTQDMNLKPFIAALAMGAPLCMTAMPHGRGIDRANLDTSARPGDDFYRYACGGWIDSHPLQPEYSRFGTFDMLRENNRTQLQELITGLAENPESRVKGSVAQKVSDLYALGMDSVRLNREGAAPIMPQVNHINSMTDKDVTDMIAWMHNGVSSVLFSTGVGADPKNSDMNILHIGEPGLGLGDRDYYLEDNESNAKIRAAYEKYIKRLMELIGYDAAAQQRVFDNVWKIETYLAQNKKTREERRNPQGRYNMRTMEQIKADYPAVDWDGYFAALGVTAPESANISSVKFMEALDKFIPTLTLQELKDYMTFEAVSEGSALMSDDFALANFEMYDKTMGGKEEQEARWKRAMAIPNSMLGEAVGELYVGKYFPEENKAYMRGLVENLRKALSKHIDGLTWMSDTTKAKAQEKLAAFTVKIGYPDKWIDYSALTIDPSKSYWANVQEAIRFNTQRNLDDYGKPVDKDRWYMSPQTVNAYYNPTTNEICFPAGILQAPYFNPDADDAENYGAIGVVIGHEMTHGFDDQGRQFDKDGNLADWWTAEDAARFNALADGLAAQFDEIEVAPGVHANGRFTLGENIADQGGLRVAYTAYHNALGEGNEGEVIDGFTPDQRFYLAYANVWAGNIREAEILKRTKTDPHSLGRWRVNASLRNIEPFFKAFDIKDGDPMFRPDSARVVIW